MSSILQQVKKVVVKQIQCHNGRVAAGITYDYIDPHNDQALADPEKLKGGCQ